jgi:hypothetical protein
VTQIATATEMGCSSSLSVLSGGNTLLCDGLPYSTKTLTAQDSSGPYVGGLAVVAPNGATAVDTGLEVVAFPAGAAPPTTQYEDFYGLSLPPSFQLNSSYPVDLAWSANSQQLFTIIESSSNYSSPVFTVLSLYPFERVPADLTLSSTATAIAYDGSFTVTPHLGVTDGNRAYSVYQTIAGHPRQLVYSCPCDPSGSFTTGGTSWTTNTTYTAVFTGDARYEPTTVTLNIKVGAKVATALSGYYKTAEVSGLQYHLYHRNATLKDWVTVTPNKQGECVRLEIQQAVKSVWRADATTGCVALNKWSQAAIPRTLSATGWYRVRADFTASARDTTNVSADGGWLYYVVPS